MAQLTIEPDSIESFQESTCVITTNYKCKGVFFEEPFKLPTTPVKVVALIGNPEVGKTYLRSLLTQNNTSTVETSQTLIFDARRTDLIVIDVNNGEIVLGQSESSTNRTSLWSLIYDICDLLVFVDKQPMESSKSYKGLLDVISSRPFHDKPAILPELIFAFNLITLDGIDGLMRQNVKYIIDQSDELEKKFLDDYLGSEEKANITNWFRSVDVITLFGYMTDESWPTEAAEHKFEKFLDKINQRGMIKFETGKIWWRHFQIQVQTPPEEIFIRKMAAAIREYHLETFESKIIALYLGSSNVEAIANELKLDKLTLESWKKKAEDNNPLELLLLRKFVLALFLSKNETVNPIFIDIKQDTPGLCSVCCMMDYSALKNNSTESIDLTACPHSACFMCLSSLRAFDQQLQRRKLFNPFVCQIPPSEAEANPRFCPCCLAWKYFEPTNTDYWQIWHKYGCLAVDLDVEVDDALLDN